MFTEVLNLTPEGGFGNGIPDRRLTHEEGGVDPAMALAESVRVQLAEMGIGLPVTAAMPPEVLRQLHGMKEVSPFQLETDNRGSHLAYAARFGSEVLHHQRAVADFVFEGFSDAIVVHLGALVLTRESVGQTLARASVQSDVGKLGPDKIEAGHKLHPIAKMYLNLDLNEDHKLWLANNLSYYLKHSFLPPYHLAHFPEAMRTFSLLPQDQQAAVRQGSFFSAPLGIIYEAAYEVKRFGIFSSSFDDDQIRKIYTLNHDDRDRLQRLGIDAFSTPFRPFLTTEAHLYCSERFYGQCNLTPTQEGEALLADQHHFSAIKSTRESRHPLSIAIGQRRDEFLALAGWNGVDELSVQNQAVVALRAAALLEVGDKIDAFQIRSGLSWKDALQVALHLCQANVTQNYAIHAAELRHIYQGAVDCIAKNRMLTD